MISVSGINCRCRACIIIACLYGLAGSRTLVVSNNIAGQHLSSTSFSSIQSALDNAICGDTVFITGGTYHESLRLAGLDCDAPENTLVICGEDSGSVIIDGRNILPDLFVAANVLNATLKNIVFRNAKNTSLYSEDAAVRLQSSIYNWLNAENLDSIAVYGCRHWRIENVMVENCAGSGLGLVFAEGCTLAHVTAQGNFSTGFAGVHNSNLTFHCCEALGNNPGWPDNPMPGNSWVFRDSPNNRYYASGTHQTGGFKLMYCNEVTIDQCRAENNGGPGCWIDCDNTNIRIQDCMFRFNRNLRIVWEGSGLFCEVNPRGPFRITGSEFLENEGPALHIAESQNISVSGNSIEGYIDLRDYELRAEELGPEYIDRNITITNNSFYDGGINTQLGTDDWTPETAVERNIVINANKWSGGEPWISWGGTMSYGLEAFRTIYGFETGVGVSHRGIHLHDINGFFQAEAEKRFTLQGRMLSLKPVPYRMNRAAGITVTNSIKHKGKAMLLTNFR
jgi:hypothetical protein